MVLYFCPVSCHGFYQQPFLIWCKLNLKIKEAAAYSNIGINRIEELLKQPKYNFAAIKNRLKEKNLNSIYRRVWKFNYLLIFK